MLRFVLYVSYLLTWQPGDCINMTPLGDSRIRGLQRHFIFHSQMPKWLCFGSHRHYVRHRFGSMCHGLLHLILCPLKVGRILKNCTTEIMKCIASHRQHVKNEVSACSTEWSGVWNTILKLGWPCNKPIPPDMRNDHQETLCYALTLTFSSECSSYLILIFF